MSARVFDHVVPERTNSYALPMPGNLHSPCQAPMIATLFSMSHEMPNMS